MASWAGAWGAMVVLCNGRGQQTLQIMKLSDEQAQKALSQPTKPGRDVGFVRRNLVDVL